MNDFDRALKDALGERASYLGRRLLCFQCMDWRSWLATFFISMSMVFVFFIMLKLLKSGLDTSLRLLLFLVVSIAIGCIMNLLIAWNRRRLANRIMDRLEDKGIRPRLCLNCGYILEGVASDHCPECGTGLAVPSINSDEVSKRGRTPLKTTKTTRF